MPVLYASDRSPYARTCRIGVIELGLENTIEVVFVNPMDDPAELLTANPLGLIPCLVRDDGTAVMDSPAIVLALEALAGVELTPRHGEAAIAERRQWGLAQGVLDVCVRWVQESRRDPTEKSKSWPARWHSAAVRTLQQLDREASELSWQTPAGWHVFTAFEYYRLVFGEDTMATLQKLSECIDAFAKRPGGAATIPDELRKRQSM